MSDTKKVFFNNTQRDSYQSNVGGLPSARERVEAEQHASQVGWHSMQTGGGTLFDVSVMRGRDPWQEQEILTNAYRDTPNSILLRGDCLVGYDIYGEDVVNATVREYVKTGMKGFTIFDAHDTRNQENAIRAVNQCKEEGFDVYAQGVICMGNSDVFTVDTALRSAQELVQMGVRDLYLKDPVGIARPDVVFEVVRRLKEEFPHDVYLHAHETHGMGARIYMAGIEAGADAIDVAHPAFGGNVAQPDALRMLDMMQRHPSASVRDRAPDLNIEALAADFESLLALRFRYMAVEPVFDRDIFDAMFKAKAPGGAASTLKNMMEKQFSAKGLNWKQAQIAIYEKQAQILPLLGDPLQVTPHAKNTTSQAAVMLILGDKQITPEIKTYLTGGYGRIPGKPDPDLQARALQATGMDAVYDGKPSDRILPVLNEVERRLESKGVENPSVRDVLTAAILNRADQGLDHVVAQKQGVLKEAAPPQLPSYAQENLQKSFPRHKGKDGVEFKSPSDVFEAIGGQAALMNLALNVLEAEKKGYYKTPEYGERNNVEHEGRGGQKYYRDTFRKWRSEAAQGAQDYVASIPDRLHDAGFQKGVQLLGGIEAANKMIADTCKQRGIGVDKIPEASIRDFSGGVRFSAQRQNADENESGLDYSGIAPA